MKLFQSLFKKNNGITVGAPIKGQLVSIKTVSDSTFRDEILGKGVAIIPTDGKVYAPDDGIISNVFPTGHAVIITTDSGIEVLIHLGIDTVKLDGKHFTIHVKDGQKITKGELLIEADIEKIKAEGYDVITPVVICNSDEFEQIRTEDGKEVSTGDVVMILKK